MASVRTVIAIACFAIAAAAASDGAWPWRGDFGNDAVTLLLVGDFNVQKRAKPADALVHVRETLNRADLVYANLEGLLVKSLGPDKDLPNKNGWQHLGPEAVQALQAGNVQAVGVANNVAFGRAELMSTLQVLNANGIAHTGGGANLQEAHKPAIVARKGVRFGFLQYTSKWYDEAVQIATADRAGVARVLSKDGISVDPSDLNRVRDDVRQLRPLVDIVVVSSHTRDGQRRPGASPTPARRPPTQSAEPDLTSELPVNPLLAEAEPYQKELARAAIDAGADVVFGHGCHMLQGVEVYKGKPILHCLGNFASDWIRVRKYKDGMVARVVAGKNNVLRVSLVPVTRDERTNNVLMLDPSAGEGSRLMQRVKELSGAVPWKVDGREVVVVDSQGSFQ
jgi:poly-gamma-glutamate synthesis protein (capsule biosynthesis protein)